MTSRYAWILLACMACAHAQASPDDERARHLAERFRCVVCQNQSLADSNADLAADLRARIREQGLNFSLRFSKLPGRFRQ